MTYAVSVVIPFYRNCDMLALQLQNWSKFSDDVRDQLKLIVVDDGSPELALDVFQRYPVRGAELYRIGKDIPWNRGGARNLGSHVASTPWLLHLDIDHVLPPGSAVTLATWVKTAPVEDKWYRFERYRVGRADATRRKDAIPESAKFGKIHPHIDSYLVSRELYWKNGGYDEAYSGCLGGGTPFIKALEKLSKPGLLPFPLHVYTRDVVKDSSDWALSREKGEFGRRRKERFAKYRTEHYPARPWKALWPWERVL